MNKNNQRVKNILLKLRSLALRIIVLFAISLQQIHPELFLLPAYADSPNPNTINFTANINSRENNFAQGTSDIKFQIQAPNGTIIPTNTKFTVFIFFGDNLYTSYKSFTASYDQFPLINYKYSKPGTYKPLLIIYSYDLKSKLFKFLDPIKVEKLNLANPIASGVINSRFEDNKNNIVNISFDARSSYDPANLFNGNSMTYIWDFGDGAKADAKAVISHIYTSYGIYTPSLIVKTPDGRTSTKFTFNPIEISKETIIPYDEYSKATDLKVNLISKLNQAPLLDSKVTYSITSDNLYMPLSKKKFTVFLFYGDNFYKDYLSFTAPFTGFPQRIVHEYKKAGKYTPLLIAYSGDLTDKIFKFLDPIIVTQAQGDKPIAQGLIDERIDSRENNIVTVNFNGSGSFDPRNNSHENLTYIWDYGDGISETIANKFIQHIYRSPGTFTPSLIVRASDGRLSEKYLLSPIVISKSIVCLGSRDTWTNLGICQANCGGINAEQLQVNACEEERFIPCTSPACKANTFTTLNEYIEANSFISLLADNGGFANKANLSYRFIISSIGEDAREQIYQNSKFYLNHPGAHSITLEIYDQSFKASTYTQTINVAESNKAPIAKAKADKYIGEVPLNINFDASESSDPENSNLTYEWNFGDGASGNGKTLSHSFDKIGSYKTWLKVTDPRGLSSQINLPEIVIEEKNYPPLAKFVKNVFDCKVSTNGEVALEYKLDSSFACNIELDALFSSDPNGNISNYQWTINHYDPITNSNQSIQLAQQTNPKFIYEFTKFGNYNINLKVTDTKGLSSDYNSTLTILEPSPILKAELKNRTDNLDLGSSLMNFSANGSIYYRNTSPLNPGTEYLIYAWDWGDGFSSNGLGLSHNYNNPGVYSPVLSVYRKNDPEKKILASKNLESLVVTTKIPVVGSLSFDNLISLEENGTSSVTGVTIGPVNNEEYKWIYHSYEKDFSGKTVLVDKSNEINNNEELNSSILDAPQSFTEAGQYQLVHQLDDKPILSETLTVLPNQIPIPKLQVVHETGSNTVTVSAEGSYDPKNYEIASYHWDFNDGASSDSINASHTYANNGVYYIKLTVIDSKGQIANAYSKAIIVGNFASTINNSIPPYQKTIDQESGDDTIPENFRMKLKQQDTTNPVSDYDRVADNKNSDPNIPIRDLSLPTAGVCSGGSCDCRKSYGQDIAVSNINFFIGNTSHLKEKGGALIEIKGSNFCKNEHNVKIKIDNSGDFIDRPSAFADNNTIIARLRSEDFKGNNITIRVTQKATDNKYYLVDKVYTNSTVNPNIRNYDVLDGNSVKIDFNNDNFFFDESTSFGNGYHYFKDNYPTTFSTDALIISKKLSLKTYTANQAKLKVHLNGNRFEGIRVWINNVLVLSRDPTPGNKFFEISSDPFSISTGALDLKVKIIGPSDDGVQVKAVTIYTAPAKPFINNLRLKLFEGISKGSKRVSFSMNTTPNTKLQAVHINRKSTSGTYKDKYIILEANGTNSDNSGIANLSFNEVNFKPGTHCTYFYLTNGSDSDQAMKEYIINNLVKPFNQAQANNKFAAINQNTFNYLRDNALPIKHGICFNEDHNVTLTIQSPTSFIFQANNQPQVVKLQSDAPPQIKSLWNYEVKLLSGQDETNAITVPWTKAKPEEFGPEAIQFPILRDYIGDYNLLIRASYFDPDTLLTYVGETSTAIHIIGDVAPKAKVVTENINKLILEPSDNPAEKASFLGQYSYDPNRASFPQVIDGIGSYSWITEFKSLESNSEAGFTNLASNYDPNASTYYIGPRKEPGIYRASLTVKDFYNNSDTAQSDTVQVIKPGQNLVAALSINNADKIFEPDLNGKKEIAFKAKVKIISAKNNKPSSVNYKFTYGDGIEESGTINLAQIEINKYIENLELTNRKHIYSQGEYDPHLEVSANFPDGHSETWTVSAGTLTIAKLPSYVAFTPIIANLAPKDIPNPGFIADLKVKSKAIYKTSVESFGWDFGDGTTWTYSGTNPTVDFMKNNVTDKKHTYNNLGIFQIKFWVKTVDAAQPIVFALKPLEIQDTPAPIFKSLTVNQASTNIKVNDEELITIAGEIETKLNLQRLELQVIAQGSNEVVFSKTYTGTVPKKFSETFNDLYLEPGNYVLDLLAFDTREQKGSGTLEFVVEKVSKADKSVDISGLAEFYKEEKFTHNNIHKLSIDINRFLKAINIYNNGKKVKSYEGVLPDADRLKEIPKLANDGYINSIEGVNSSEIYTTLREGNNKLQIEIILPNGKIIKTKPYLITLDSTRPLIQIKSPLDISVHGKPQITLAGKVYDENLAKLFYRINSNTFTKLDFEEVPEELDLNEFEKDLNLTNADLKESNFIEIKAVDRGGNTHFANTSFIISNEIINEVTNKPWDLKFYVDFGESLDEEQYNLPQEKHDAGDRLCDSILWHFGGFMDKNFTNVHLPYYSDQVYGIDPADGYYVVRQGNPFNIDFKLQVCDYNKGEPRTTVYFAPLNPRLVHNNSTYYPTNYLPYNTAQEGVSSRYYFPENVAGPSSPQVYLEFWDMNYNGIILKANNTFEKVYFDPNKLETIAANWNYGKYDFYSDIQFHDINENINGTFPDADQHIGIKIVDELIDESIEIIDVKRIPDVVYAGHDIDSVAVTARVALLSNSIDAKRFDFYLEGPITKRLYKPENTYYEPLGTQADTSGRYLFNLYFKAYNLPTLKMFGDPEENIDEYNFLVRLLNEAGDTVISESRKQIKILPAPERYIDVKAEEVFPETYTNEQKLKEEGFVSLNPKQFKLTVYHIADNGLTLQEKLEGFDASLSPILNRLKIRKISLDNLDQYADISKIPDSQKTEWNGNKLNFTLVKDSIYVHQSNKSSGITDKEIENYKGFWKTEYISSGPDNGKTLIKDAGKLEFSINMEDWFAKQKNAGFGFSNQPDQFDSELYDLDPYPIELKDIEISADNLFFQPNLDKMIETPDKVYLNAGQKIFSANLSYEDKITDQYRLPKFEYKPRKSKTNEEKKKIKAGFLINNQEEDERAFVALSLFSNITDDINLDSESSNNYNLDLTVDFVLNNDNNVFLKKDEMANLNENKTLQVPISIITKSNKDLDIELRGTYTQKAFPVSILDLPKFELMQGKRAEKLSPEELIQQSTKITLDSKDNLFLHTKYSNIVGKGNGKTKVLGFDPLELEVQLYDGGGLALGQSFLINKSIMSKTISTIESKGYSVNSDDPSINKTLDINLSQYMPAENKEFAEEAEYVRVKLKRDFTYLQGIVPTEGNIYQYYDVDDNDLYRSKYLKITSGRKNTCYFSFPGSNGRHKTLTAFNESSINGKLLVNFTSASRKKAKIWVTYITSQSTAETNVTFNETNYSSNNLQDTKNPGSVVEVDPSNNRVGINEGIFNFKDIDLPQSNRYTLLFKVAESSASENSVNWTGFDAEKAAVCTVDIVKGIPDATVFIDRLEPPNVINLIPVGRDYNVIVRTNPAESIAGVNLYIKDIASGARALLSKLHAVPDGAYIRVNLNSFGLRTLNKPYRLIAELTYNTDNSNEQKTDEKAYRDFMFVDDTEPTITFGANGINDLGDPGSGNNGNDPNVIYAPAGTNYHFNGTVMFTGIKEENINKISFKLIDVAANQEAKDHEGHPIKVVTTSQVPTNNVDEYTYSISTLIPFTEIEDIKEYILEAYFDNQRLSQYGEFFIIDDPTLNLKLSKENIEFDENNEASLNLTATINGGFARELIAKATSFETSSSQNLIYDDKKSKMIVGDGIEVPIQLSVSEDLENPQTSNFNVIALNIIRLLLRTHSGQILLGATATYTASLISKLTQTLPKTFSDIVVKQQEITKEKSIPLTNIQFIDVELQDINGNKKLFFDNSSSFKLQVRSSNMTKIIINQRNNNESSTLEILNHKFTEQEKEGMRHNYPLSSGEGTSLQDSYSTITSITPPSIIDGHIGITTLDIQIEDKEGQLVTSSYTFTLIRARDAEVSCVIQEIINQSPTISTVEQALRSFVLFITEARKMSFFTSFFGFNINSNEQYAVNTGDLIEDLVRILPLTEKRTFDGQGYCQSLANHIVNRKNRQGLIRIFESKNHRPEETADNYNIYWLSNDRLRHIYQRHGSLVNLSSTLAVEPFRTKFNYNDNIVELIKNNITNSTTRERNVPLQTSNPGNTSFTKTYSSRAWKDALGFSTNKIMTITNFNNDKTNKSYLRIETAYPLSSQTNDYRNNP